MSPELEVASEDQGIFETMHQMRNPAIRSPVVSADGSRAGIISTDDLI